MIIIIKNKSNLINNTKQNECKLDGFTKHPLLSDATVANRINNFQLEKNANTNGNELPPPPPHTQAKERRKGRREGHICIINRRRHMHRQRRK